MDKVADPELIFFFQKRTSRTAKFNICHLVALGSNGSAYGTPTGFQMVISNFNKKNDFFLGGKVLFKKIEFEQKVRTCNPQIRSLVPYPLGYMVSAFWLAIF